MYKKNKINRKNAKMNTERKIPDLKHSLLTPLSFDKLTENQYVEKIEKFERDCEKKFISICESLGIQAKVKTDPYLLPYTDELVVTLMGESYLNGAYEFERVAYKMMKEILNKNLYQFRFYMFINVKDRERFPIMGSVEYCFRYYDKNKKK